MWKSPDKTSVQPVLKHISSVKPLQWDYYTTSCLQILLSDSSWDFSLFFPSWPLSIFCLLILYQPKFISIFWRRKCALRGFIGFYFAVCGRGLFFLSIQTKPACFCAAPRGWFWRLDVFIEWVVYKKWLCWPCTWSSIGSFIFSGNSSLVSTGMALVPEQILLEEASSDLCSVCTL